MEYTPQPIFCSNCGKQRMGHPVRPWCNQACWQQLMWKETLYIRGKEYYEQPEEGKHNYGPMPSGSGL